MTPTNEHINESKRTYEEWKHDILNLFSSKQHIKDAIWNAMYEYAEKEGFADEMEADEDDIDDMIDILCTNYNTLK